VSVILDRLQSSQAEEDAGPGDLPSSPDGGGAGNGKIPKDGKHPQRRNTVRIFLALAIAASSGGLFVVKYREFRNSKAIPLSLNPPRAWEELVIGNRLGMELFYSGKISMAAGQFEALTRKNPGNAALWINWGISLRRSGKLPEAVRVLEQSLKIDPDNAEALSAMGRVRLDLGDTVSAKDFFEKALKTRKASPEALLELGKISEQSSNWAEASEFYKRYLEGDVQSAIKGLLLARIEKIGNRKEEFNGMAQQTPARHRPGKSDAERYPAQEEKEEDRSR
jgi:Tfp pilus assembly protein PilF